VNQQALIDAIDNGAAKISHTHDGTSGNGPQIAAAGLAAGAATDTVIGQRTINDNLTAAGNTYDLTTFLSALAGMEKKITGKANWYTAPITSLESLNTAMGTKANAANASLTGTPIATTAGVDTNTSQIATTAFVLGQAGANNPNMNGAATPGSSLRYSRQDHVHPVDTSRAPTESPTFSGTAAFNNVSITGVLTASAPAASAMCTGNTALAANNMTKIVCNSTTFDVKGNYDAINGKFTAPSTGKYMVTFSAFMGGAPTGTWYTSFVFVNASLYKKVGSAVVQNTAYFITTGVCTVNLNAGDYLEFYAFSNAASCQVGGNETTISVIKV
jgi:hypothetical protein